MIDGIFVELRVGSLPYSPTGDPLYLGIYGKNGGREFALDADSFPEFNQVNKISKLKIGQGCCDDNALQVRYSSNDDGNTTINYPLYLDDIEYVYLRKQQKAVESSSNPDLDDNLLVLKYCKVLICDSDSKNKIRCFKAKINMFFGNEVGLRHWLVEGRPPGCKITTTIDTVHYGGENIDNRNIELDLTYRINGNSNRDLIDNLLISKFNHGTIRRMDAKSTGNSTGCCGSTHSVSFHAFVRDHDLFAANPIGSTNQNLEIKCTEDGSTINYSIDVSVRDSKRRKTGIFTFKGKIIAECE